MIDNAFVSIEIVPSEYMETIFEVAIMIQLDPARNSLWRLFLTTHTRLVERVERDLKEAGLPPFEWYDVLVALKQAPEQRLRLNELAEAVLLSRTNLTRLVDRLEKADLLRREACKDDRRGAFAVLTEAGLAMQQKMWTVYAQSIAQHFGRHLSDTYVKVLTQALSAMLAVVDDSKITEGRSTTSRLCIKKWYESNS